MKKTLTTLAIICTLTAFGQTSQEHLQNGFTKQGQGDCKGAIQDYDKSIKEDKTNKLAYYNRGVCNFFLKDFKSAMTDFNKTIELDPKFVKAYYYRAKFFYSQEKYTEALPDLGKIIELNPTYSIFTLSGRIRKETGNKQGACDDLHQALQIGDKQAEKYLNEFICLESFKLYWPNDWRFEGSQLIEQGTSIRSYFQDNYPNMNAYGGEVEIYGYGAKNIPLDKIMNNMFDEAKLYYPKAKLTFIEKDESVYYPWIIFTFEIPNINFNTDKTPESESQLWYIVQGKKSLYKNFRSVKQATVPSDLKDKWIKFFKTGKVIYK